LEKVGFFKSKIKVLLKLNKIKQEEMVYFRLKREFYKTTVGKSVVK